MELIGRRFGHIRITDVVGEGGMGDVYAGYDEKLDRKVALKVLHAENRLDAESRERLQREARALSKLDHPNICRIHDYIESEDVDVLVLEYIPGSTLQDLVQGPPVSRGEVLRIAIAIAEVLVAAHRAGIIHRDLKPENVMLTEHGEVKVLDFGLARLVNMLSISARYLALATPDGGAGRVPLRTAIGTTVGTPLYMSPEQARGVELTPASDMFSFGLLLQTLFTKKEPHRPGLSAREVMLRAARGETVEAVGVPGDVAALIARMKQFAPTDRPTAVEALSRLRHLADRNRRIARRAAIAAAVAVIVLGAWRYTVDLARERTKAIDARAEAEERRAQAENLLEFMLGDLRRKLVPVGRLDILDEVGKRSLAYAESLNPAIMSADELARNAKALTQLGEVRMGQGNLEEAVAMFNRAMQFSRVGATREPNHRDVQLAYGTAHFWLGDVSQRRGDLPRALTHMRAYLDVAESLGRAHPLDETLQLERAYGHGNVGSVLEAQGDLRGALAHYQKSYEIKNMRLQRDPADSSARAEMARSINKVARVQQRLGDLAGAREGFEREVETYRFLVAADPHQTQWKQRLAASLAFLSALRKDLGDGAGALECAEEELTVNRQLAARDPANVEWQRNLAMASWRVADLLRRDDLPRALQLSADADRIMRAAVGKVPARRDWVLELAGIDGTYSRILSASKQHARARELLLDTVGALKPADGAWERFRAAEAWLHLGEIHRATGSRTEAVRAWSNAHAQLNDVAPASASPQMLRVWIPIVARLGMTDQARAGYAQFRSRGYHDPEVEIVCRDEGC